METLLSTPALVKILCVFCLLLLLNRLGFRLSSSLLIGALVLGLWMGLGPLLLAQSAFASLIHWQTISLILIVGTILVMSGLMKESGHLDRIVQSFGKLSRDDRTSGSVMPALIGLLPMPGGALFSAPMVESALQRRSMPGEVMTAVNYWFRHIWEYWWPLYPGVALAVSLLGVDTWQFMGIMAPMTLVTVLAGIVFILRPQGKMPVPEKEAPSGLGMRGFLWEIMPILIVVFMIAAMAGLNGLLTLLGIEVKIAGAISILPGLIIATLWVGAVNHISFNQFRLALTGKEMRPMLLLIAAIMVFKGLITDSQAVYQIRNELGAYEVPVIIIILIMPFLSGLITGIAIGFVGASFPLIIPLFQTEHLFDYLSYAALAYTSGFIGMMLSPVHLCFLVSKDYFKASPLKIYRHLFMPALTVMVSAALIFLISRAF